MFGVLLMQRECTSMLSGVAVNVGRGVVIVSNAESGIRNGLKRVCFLLFVFCNAFLVVAWKSEVGVSAESLGFVLKHFPIVQHVVECST